MGTSSYLGDGLVDRNPLHERCEIAGHLDGGIAQPLVFLAMPAHKNEFWAELTRSPPGIPLLIQKALAS